MWPFTLLTFTRDTFLFFRPLAISIAHSKIYFSLIFYEACWGPKCNKSRRVQLPFLSYIIHFSCFFNGKWKSCFIQTLASLNAILSCYCQCVREAWWLEFAKLLWTILKLDIFFCKRFLCRKIRFAFIIIQCH